MSSWEGQKDELKMQLIPGGMNRSEKTPKILEEISLFIMRLIWAHQPDAHKDSLSPSHTSSSKSSSGALDWLPLSVIYSS